jgi:hypothetical protein
MILLFHKHILYYYVHTAKKKVDAKGMHDVGAFVVFLASLIAKNN